MGNNTDEQIPMKTISELKDLVFTIPAQQRGYKWTTDNVKELLEDFRDFIKSDKKIYCLQPLAVVALSYNNFCVLDGQQRLTTIFLLWKYLFNKNPYTFVFERDKNLEDGDEKKRWEFLKNIDGCVYGELTENSIDCFFIDNAFNEIRKWFAKEKLEDQFKNLLDAKSGERQTVQVIWYEVPKNKEYEVFRNLNSGKIALNNSELIKALFLNRASGLGDKLVDEAATQLEQMERMVQNDHFWYMFADKDVSKGQSRMDLIYNLVAGISKEDYERDPRSAFRQWFDNKDKGDIRTKWNSVRKTFLCLYDMYSDLYIYHYIGFLTFVGGKNYSADKMLKWYKTTKKSDFVKKLREEIKNTLLKVDNLPSLEAYSYEVADKSKLRQLFVLHNIETILNRYENLHDNQYLQLQHEFEWFPFELLHKLKWDIEHIASQTESKFNNEQDREDWLQSIKADSPKYLEKDEDVKSKLAKYKKTGKDEDFKKLYKRIIEIDEDEKANGNAIKEEDKDQLGNLVLLDNHTNRSYHNSLFPRKRRFVIIAEGLKSADDKDNVPQLYIPICTRQCFTKSYNKGSDVILNAWTQKDADAYRKDIQEKLKYYFPNSDNKN